MEEMQAMLRDSGLLRVGSQIKMLGFARSVRVRAIRLVQRYLELRDYRRKILFAKDYSYGKSPGHAITSRIGITFPKAGLTLAQ